METTNNKRQGKKEDKGMMCWICRHIDNCKEVEEKWNLDGCTEEQIYKNLVDTAGFDNAHNLLADSTANREVCQSQQMIDLFRDEENDI
eukprot:1246785-Ditylum_brightwellii.AAC.1